MYPILFTISGQEIRSYHVFLLIGLLLGLWVGWSEARRYGFDNRRIITSYLLIVPVALGLGIVNGWLFNLDFYRALQNSKILLNGGLISFGIILGALALGAIYARLNHDPVGRMLDMISLVLPIMLGITRIGCLLNGCCYGGETDGFGAVYLPDHHGHWANRYPTQPALGIFDLILFVLLWTRRYDKPYDGYLTVLFLLWFSGGRFIIDDFRDLPDLFIGLSFHQLASTAIFIGALIVYLKFRLSKRKTASLI